jgi:hypothetical protein
MIGGLVGGKKGAAIGGPWAVAPEPLTIRIRA